MNIVFQSIIKVKDYILTIDYRCLISICFITLLVLLFITFRQYQFQSPYLIRSFYKPLSKTRNSTNQTTTKSQLTKIIVVSHYNEHLDWLDLFIGELIPHIVYTRSSDSLTRHNIPINKDREAVAYLRYIVDSYSNLSSLIAFVHT